MEQRLRDIRKYYKKYDNADDTAYLLEYIDNLERRITISAHGQVIDLPIVNNVRPVEIAVVFDKELLSQMLANGYVGYEKWREWLQYLWNALDRK